MSELLHKDIMEKVIEAAFQVYQELGHGFLPKVYQQAIVRELTQRGLKCVERPPAPTLYKGAKRLGYFGDFLVEEVVMVELRTDAPCRPTDDAQLLNQLRALSQKVCLILYLGRDGISFKRMVL